MIELTHYNDHKEKWQSHEIELREKDFSIEIDDDVWVHSHNPFYITGYGATKDQAIEDFKKKFIYVVSSVAVVTNLFAFFTSPDQNSLNIDFSLLFCVASILYFFLTLQYE